MKAIQFSSQWFARRLLCSTNKYVAWEKGIQPSVAVGLRKLQTSAADDAKRKKPSVADFYRNKNVFITGGTGFMGKTFVEKLLRSCPDLDHIYLLIRGKNGKHPNERLEEYFSNAIFDQVKNRDASILKKVKAVQGDVMKDNIGISESDRNLLKEKIHIMINAAATVKFMEPIQAAADVHITGQMRSVDLAEEMKNLEAFVQVSSFGVALAHPERRVGGTLQPLHISAADLLEVIRTTDDAKLKEMQNGDLMGCAKPYTYFFCKSIAEHEMSARMEKAKIPLAIIRPAWVQPPAREPIPGWMDKDSIFMFTSIINAVGNGSLRAVQCLPDTGTQMIPGDAAANVTLASAWALKYHPNHEQQWPRIYTMSSSPVHPLTCATLERSVYRVFSQYPAKKQYHPLPKKWMYQTRPAFLFNHFTKLWAPAIMKDLWCSVTGKPQTAKAAAKEIEKLVGFGSFIFKDSAELKGELSEWFKLNDQLSPEDRETFWMDIRGLDWDKYCDDIIFGIKKYGTEDM